MSVFTQRHYEKVARALMSTKPIYMFDDDEINAKTDQWERTCLAFLNLFATDNAKFERTKFMKACKGER